MALGWSTALANAIQNAFLNAGTALSFLDSAVVDIRGGTRAATADTAPTGTVLASITTPADAMAAASGGACAKSGTWSDLSADSSGEATWFRVTIAGDAGTTNTTDLRLDGSISGVGGGGDMELTNTAVAAGTPVVVQTFAFSLPG